MARHRPVESGSSCSLYNAMAEAIVPAPTTLAPATAPPRMRSNGQREQLNDAYSDQQHHKRHGIVIQPVSVLYAHDIPHVRFFSRSGGAKGSGRARPAQHDAASFGLKSLILLS